MVGAEQKAAAAVFERKGQAAASMQQRPRTRGGRRGNWRSTHDLAMRPTILNPLFAAASSLPGVGPAVAKTLARLKIARVVDLAFHLPTMFIERVPLRTIDPCYEGRAVILSITVDEIVPGQGRTPTRVRVRDSHDNPFTLVYFGDGGAYARRLLPEGARRVVSGRLERYGDRLQITHPDYVVAEGEAGTIPAREPVYPLTEGMTNKRLGGLAAAAVARAPDLAEWAAPAQAEFDGWPRWRDALARAHALDGAARARLAYDELFAGQLALLLVRASTKRRPTRPLPGTGALVARMLAGLPYRPTGAQARAIAEIGADMATPEPMLRLLQGDVGAGKTLVAAAAMLRAVESGAQAALLAPTELLARQHAATLAGLFAGLPVRVEVLTGRDRNVPRGTILEGLETGEVQVLIGTHAIFQDSVTYRSLGLVVIDEQHRFGVSERKALTDKGTHGRPHLLSMTATPIPRTLTLTAYGEMDVSRLDEMPPGREPVETRVISLERLDEVYDALGRHIAGGGQAYWVCPLVDGSETQDDAAAETRAAELRGRFGAERVALVHGRLRPGPKDAAMAAFAGGHASVLVATTVIEVGVDVPAATLIVIEAAERFGLAQLHQLRGRVGRGGGRSMCLLLRGEPLSETARQRLAFLKSSTDGFALAEKDLELRGAGELLGTRQSGDPAFRVATPEHVARLLEAARADAAALVRDDPALASPRGQAARVALYLFERDAAVGLLRSG